ncbi:MAG: SUMF1/EgtB/PvdO family nonheme iron enzyme [Planctomycetota bacterium]
MRKLNIALFFLLIVLFIVYLILIPFNPTKIEHKVIGQKITAHHQLTENMIMLSKIENQLSKIKKTKGENTTIQLSSIKKYMEEINPDLLNYTYKKKFKAIKKEIEKIETTNRFLLLFNNALKKNNFIKATSLSKILYTITRDKDIIRKIKRRKILIYVRKGDKEFSKNNYIGAKNFYLMALTLDEKKQIKEKIGTIEHLLTLAQTQTKSVDIAKTIQKAKNYESSYKLLHSYYILKNIEHKNKDIKRALSVIAKKWQETKRIAKNFLKEVFTLINKDTRQYLELAKKKLELAKKYFPYFYKYDAISIKINTKLEYVGMILIPEGTVEYIHPRTKKIVSKKVKSFYIDRQYIEFGEYLDFLLKTNKQKVELLRKKLLDHKFRGDVTNKPLELISFHEIKNFAKNLKKRLPTLAEAIRLCKYEKENNFKNTNIKKLSILTQDTFNITTIAVGSNYLMTNQVQNECNIIFHLPKNIAVPGIGIKLVKDIKK